ncbi:hypothetical protein ABTY53_10825 [Streptomyces noursei]|uniref:hypothetical protein n=1 Tax=Streptomyces noursei TaxID=1971 RepID=UPI00331BB2BD
MTASAAHSSAPGPARPPKDDTSPWSNSQTVAGGNAWLRVRRKRPGPCVSPCAHRSSNSTMANRASPEPTTSKPNEIPAARHRPPVR